jgi:hypothetical protein
MDFNCISKRCHIFEKLASEEKTSIEISVVKNNDEFLSKLSSLKSFDDRIELLKDHFKMLGEGSSRMVFDFGKDKIIKLAKNDLGIAQNLEEARISAQRTITNSIIVADPKGKYNIMRKIDLINKDEFKKLTGMDFADYAKALHYKFNNENNYEKPKTYDKLIENDFFKDVVKFIADCDLQIGDLKKINSYGIFNDKVVISDFGLSRDVFNELYA